MSKLSRRSPCCSRAVNAGGRERSHGPRHPWAAALMMLLCVSLPGCTEIGFLAEAAGGGPKKVKVKPEYRGLEGKSVAVVVAADEYMLFDHPDAPEVIARAVTQRLKVGVPGIRMLDPKQVLEFQSKNPYWNTTPYGELMQRLGAERLVHVDLAEFGVHDPGNSYLWQGRATAGVGVAASDAKDPDTLVYLTRISTLYPEDESLGVVNADDDGIRAGLVFALASQIAGRFHDHTVIEGK